MKLPTEITLEAKAVRNVPARIRVKRSGKDITLSVSTATEFKFKREDKIEFPKEETFKISAKEFGKLLELVKGEDECQTSPSPTATHSATKAPKSSS